jgi:hypothetical protein
MPDDIGARLGGYPVGSDLDRGRQVAERGRDTHRERGLDARRPQLAQSLGQAQFVHGARPQALHDPPYFGNGLLQPVAQPDGPLGQIGLIPQAGRQAVELQGHSGQLGAEEAAPHKASPAAALTQCSSSPAYGPWRNLWHPTA